MLQSPLMAEPGRSGQHFTKFHADEEDQEPIPVVSVFCLQLIRSADKARGGRMASHATTSNAVPASEGRQQGAYASTGIGAKATPGEYSCPSTAKTRDA